MKLWPWKKSGPKVTVNMGGDVAELLVSGKAIFLAVVVYVPDTERLTFLFPEDQPAHEVAAIMAKFGCCPKNQMTPETFKKLYGVEP